MKVKPKHQRLILVVLAVAALVGAVLLAMWGLQDRAAYFVTPSDIAAGKVQPDKAMRLGGMVVKGSLKRDQDGLTVRFTVSDAGRDRPSSSAASHLTCFAKEAASSRKGGSNQRPVRRGQHPRQA